MKERPILFQGAMVRALLAGTKTQTRRALRVQPRADVVDTCTFHNPQGEGLAHFAWDPVARELGSWYAVCPYGQVGDRLWVRETWQWNGGMLAGQRDGYSDLYVTYIADGERRIIPANGTEKTPEQPPQREGEIYSLRDAPADFQYDGSNTYSDRLTKWWARKIPAIHMPRWASRILLEITQVRMQRLQDISEEDAKAEGCESAPLFSSTSPMELALLDWPLRDAKRPWACGYALLWDSINGAGAWDRNPWVWAVSFKRITP